jgi:hypothetical protein
MIKTESERIRPISKAEGIRSVDNGSAIEAELVLQSRSWANNIIAGALSYRDIM